MLNRIKSILEWLGIIWTVGTVAWWGMSVLNIMPYYRVEIHPVNTVNPLIYFFPGQQIRLNFDLNNLVSRTSIHSAQWSLLKKNKVLHTEDGLEPTIPLPLTEGGLYKLKVALLLDNDAPLTGETNLYVVQDKPKQVTLSSPLNVPVTADNSPTFVKNAVAKGIEIYSMGHWTKAAVVSASPTEVVVGIGANATVSTYNNKMLLRVQGSSKELGNYGSASLPTQLIAPKSPSGDEEYQ